MNTKDLIIVLGGCLIGAGYALQNWFEFAGGIFLVALPYLIDLYYARKYEFGGLNFFENRMKEFVDRSQFK